MRTLMQLPLSSRFITMSTIRKGILFLVFVGSAIFSLAQVIYVDKDATGSNNGTSWVNAFTNIQSALDNASASDEIWIADGIYTLSTNLHLMSIPAHGLKVLGGFTGTETQKSQRNWMVNQTVLDGNGLTSILSLGQFSATNTFWDGLYMINSSGSAVSLSANTATFVNIWFENNNAATNGGAVSMISSNAEGVVDATFFNCVFENNSAGQLGGAVFIDIFGSDGADSTTPSFINCTFYGNSASGSGGAIATNTSGSQAHIANALIANSIFFNNTATTSGPTLWHQGTATGSTSTSTITYSSFNVASFSTSFTGQGSVPSLGTGVLLSTNPQFVDAPGADFRVISGSPVVDAGNNLVFPFDVADVDDDLVGAEDYPFDFGGGLRVENGTVDYGAMEGPVEINYALDFDGVNDFVSGSGMNISNQDFTIEMWFDTDNTTTSQTLFSVGNVGAGNQAMHVVINNNNTNEIKVGLFFDDVTFPWTATSGWHHLALVHSTSISQSTIYIDGVLIGSANHTGPFTGNGNFTIGRNAWDPSGFFDGRIDELRVWSVAKYQPQIVTFKDVELTALEPNLLAYYNFSDGPTVSILTDVSPSALNGTLNNMDPNTDWVEATHSVGPAGVLDSTDPTPIITSVASPGPTTLSPIPISISFGEPVAGFAISDLTVGNGLPSNLNTSDNINFTLDITPISEGPVSIDLVSNRAFDMTGNGNTTATQFTIEFEQLKVTTVTPAVNALNIPVSANISINFNGAVNLGSVNNGTPGDVLDDNIIVNGSLSGRVEGVYSGGGTNVITFNPTSDFESGEVITVTITNQVQGLGGETAETYTYQFTAQSPAGNGNFVGNQTVINAAANGANDIKAADLNGDGHIDIYASVRIDNSIQWYINNGSGNVGALQQVIVNGPEAVEAADINGDGLLDLVVGANTNQVLWYANNGSGGFGSANVVSSAESGIRDVHAVDVDNDGDMDIISAAGTGVTSVLRLFTNDGLGGFSGSLIQGNPGTDEPYSIFSADIDGDGDLDILTGGQTDDLISWYENGNAWAKTVIGITNGASSVYAADIDGDGDVDVLSAARNAGAIVWYRNLSNGTSWTPATIDAAANSASGVHAADLDGDGFMDVLSAYGGGGTHAVAWYKNNGSELFSKNTISTTVTGAYAVYAADINTDGALDFLAAAETADQLIWYRQGASPPLAPTNLIAFASSPTQITLQWTDNATNETGYIIERAEDFAFTINPTNVVSGLSINSSSYVFNAGSNQGYFFRVIPTNGAETFSSFSSVEHATTRAFAAAALKFDGTNDHISIPHQPSLNFVGSGDFTIEAWVYYTGGAAKTILSKGDGNGVPNGDVFIFQIQSGKIALELTSGSTTQWGYSATDVPVNQWSHVAVSFAGNTASFYLDGVLDGTNNYGFGPVNNSDTNPMFIGKQGWNCNCNYFDGRIDELKIWNAAKTNFSDITTRPQGNEANLLAYYSFDENTFAKLVDRSRNINNGDLQNGPAWVTSYAGFKPFVTTWQTTGTNEIVIILTNGPGYNFQVSWGDDSDLETFSGSNPTVTHNYVNPGMYTVRIYGSFPRIYINNHSFSRLKIMSVEQWGDVAWLSMSSAFAGCENMVVNATDIPNLNGVSDLSSMFDNVSNPVAFNNADFTNWNTGTVTNMSYMFYQADGFNLDISTWNTSAVTNMESIFEGAIGFNRNLSNWNISSVQNLAYAFYQATSYNQSLGAWDISSVTDMTGMLDNTALTVANYDATLNGWAFVDGGAGESGIPVGITLGAAGLEYSPTGAIDRTTLTGAPNNWMITGDAPEQIPFVTTWITTDNSITIPTGTGSFNYELTWTNLTSPGIGDGSAAGVTTNYFIGGLTNGHTYQISIKGDFPHFFMNGSAEAPKLQTVQQWGEIAWGSMERTFDGCINLILTAVDNPNLSGVSSMRHMFNMAYAFNQDIGSWDVSSVTDMTGLFANAISFNQDLSNWDVSSVTNMSSMFGSAGSFNQDISLWDVSSVQIMQNMFAGATAFNQDISAWDVSLVYNMFGMLYLASSFNQNLGSWDIGNVTDMTDMLNSTSLSLANYDATLNGWAFIDGGAGEVEIQPGVTLGADGLFYSGAGGVGRTTLTDAPNNWIITGDALQASPPLAPTNLIAYQTSATDITIQWTDNATDELNYRVERANDYAFTVNPIVITSGLSANSTSYVFSAGTNLGYFFRVTPINGAENTSSSSSVEFASTEPFPAYAIDLNGTTHIVQTTSETNITEISDGGFTLEAWIYPWDLSGAHSILRKTGDYDLYINGGVLTAEVWQDGTSNRYMVTGASGLATFTWQHVAFTWDGVNGTFYVDGASFNGVESGPTVVNNPQLLSIGASSFYGNYFAAYIDEVQIWDNVKTDFSGRFGPPNLTDSNLLGYWSFDENTGNKAVDRSRNTNDGTLQNFPAYTPSGPFTLPPAPFITTWNTANTGVSTSTQIQLPVFAESSFSFNVYWEEVGNPANNGTAGPFTELNGPYIINFGTSGNYRVEVTGDFPRLRFNNGGDRLKLLTIEQWGDNVWSSFADAFYGCANLTIPAVDAPVFDASVSLSQAFRGCTSLNSPLNHWNTSSVTNLANTFNGATSFNQPLDAWDVSLVETTLGMFEGASSFNAALNGWNTSTVNVTTISRMFRNASAFNQDISGWDVQNVTDMSQMFWGASAFNQPIGAWSTPSLTVATNMFRNATAFNQNLNSWDVSGLTSTLNMFADAQNFNGDISTWDVSNVTDFTSMFYNAFAFDQALDWTMTSAQDISYMFQNATLFNQDLSSWNMPNLLYAYNMFEGAAAFNSPLNWSAPLIEDISYMFWNATSFNQDLSSWNTSNVYAMYGTFEGASSFNQSLAFWDVSQVTNMSTMLDNSGLSAANYDATLNGWAAQTVQNGVFLGAAGLTYTSAGQASRTILTSAPYNWDISGDVLLSSPPLAPTNVIAYASSPTEITIQWTDNATDEISYLIERADDFAFTVNPLNVVMGLSANTTSYVFNTGLNQGYFFRVIPINGAEDATSFSSVEFATTEGFPGYALNFDGAGDYIVATPTLPVTTNPRTLEFWVRMNDLASAQVLANWGNTGTLEAFGLYTNGSRLFVYTHGSDFDTGYDLDLQWHHLAVTYDGTTVRIYADGSPTPNPANVMALNTQPATGLVIGTRVDLNASYDAHAAIDELRVWDVAKTDFTDRLGSLVGSETNLIAYYSFDENTGITLVDRTANTNNGDLFGGPSWIPSQASMDVTPPNVTITSLEPSPTNADPIVVYIDFTEFVTGFDITDVVVGNGTKSNFQGSGANYTVDISPIADGAVTVNVGAGVALDLGGNSNNAATQFSILADLTAPQVVSVTAYSNPAATNIVNGTTTELELYVVFDEAMITDGSAEPFIDFPVEDPTSTITFSSGAWNDPFEYSAFFTVTDAELELANIDVRVSLAQDLSGNLLNPQVETDVFTIDMVNPTVLIGTIEPDPTTASPFTISFDFSEGVADFIDSDIMVGNGTASNLQGTGAYYTADITPSTVGLVTVDLIAAVVNDLNGNPNQASTQFQIYYCEVPIVIAAPVDITNCSLPNGTITGTATTAGGEPTSYTITIYAGVGTGGAVILQDNTVLDGSIGLTATGLLAGTYTVEVINNDTGCSATTTGVVSDNLSLPVINAGNVVVVDETSLGANDGSIDVSGAITGSAGPFTYYLYDDVLNPITNNGTGVFTNLAPGDYVVDVVDNISGCVSNPELFTIPPGCELPIVIATPVSNTSCTVPNGSITGTASTAGGEPTSYTITIYAGIGTGGAVILQDNTVLDGSIGLTATGLLAGTYTVEVNNNDTGCGATTTSSVTDNQIAPIINSGTVAIQDETVSGANDGYIDASTALTGGVGPFTYNLYDDLFNPITSNATGLFVNLGPGDYNMDVLDNGTGCVSSPELFTIMPGCEPPAITVGSVIVTHETGLGLNDGSIDALSAVSGGSGIYQFDWFLDAGLTSYFGSGESIVNLAPGTYYLIVTDLNTGCLSTVESFIVFSDCGLPVIDLVVTANTLCVDADGTLVTTVSSPGGEPSSYTITVYEGMGTTGAIVDQDVAVTDGSTGLTTLGLPAGDYTVEVTNNDGNCIATSSTTIVDQLDLPLINQELVIVTGETVAGLNNGSIDATQAASGGSGDYTYSWFTGIGTNQPLGGNTSSLASLAPGSYTLVVTDVITDCASAMAHFVVAAANGDGSTTAFPATNLGYFNFRANWASMPDAQFYRIDIAEDAAFTQLLKSNVGVATNYYDLNTGLKYDKTYYYRVRVVYASGISPNSNVATAKTLRDQLTEQDSAALVLIYNTNGGNAWKNKDGWKISGRRLETWAGVNMTGTRVTSLDLSANGLIGTLPGSFADANALGLLTILNLSDNELDDLGAISLLPTLNTLDVSANRLDFEDLEPIVGQLPSFTYAPQKQVGTSTYTLIPRGSNTTISFTEIVADSYQWSRNGTLLAGELTATLNITDISYETMGDFTLSMTDADVPGLTLISADQTVLATGGIEVTVYRPGNQLLEDGTAYLLKIGEPGVPYDTTMVVEFTEGDVFFDVTILGDYLISVHGDPVAFLPSYLGNTFLWEEAETIFFREITQSVDIEVTPVPGPRDPSNPGRISGYFDVEYSDDDARVDARRRTANVRCHVRRRTTGGRETEDVYVLIASVVTDENGEFDIPSLPVGFYRINFEYPGVPMDQNSFVQFEVTAVGDNSYIQLAAAALESGVIEVTQILPLAVALIKDIKVYPIPANSQLTVAYTSLICDQVKLVLYDINGRVVRDQILPRADRNELVLPVNDLGGGMYLLNIIDTSQDMVIGSYKVMIMK